MSAILSNGGRDGPSVSSPNSSLSTAFAALRSEIEDEERNIDRKRSDCMEVRYRKEQHTINVYKLGKNYTNSKSITNTDTDSNSNMNTEQESMAASVFCNTVIDEKFNEEYHAVDMDSKDDRENRRLERHNKIKQQRKEKEILEKELDASAILTSGGNISGILETLLGITTGIGFITGGLEEKKKTNSNITPIVDGKVGNVENLGMIRNSNPKNTSPPVNTAPKPYEHTYHPVLDVLSQLNSVNSHVKENKQVNITSTTSTTVTDNTSIIDSVDKNVYKKKRINRFSFHNRKSIAPPGVHSYDSY